MIGIPVGILAANATEWVVHRYVLHGLGRKKNSFWAFHWHEHHKHCRRHGHRDPDYERSVVGRHSQGKEAAALIAGVALISPLTPIAPFFVGTMAFCAGEYWYKHRKSHLDPDWARENLTWHYDHHMGPDQDANWCVVRPWFDHLMGTRKPYVGTERERRDNERKSKRRARHSATPPRMPVAQSDYDRKLQTAA